MVGRGGIYGDMHGDGQPVGGHRTPATDTAQCSLCAAVESPGFYTGCMIADGYAGPGCEWECDGKGNLTRRKTEGQEVFDADAYDQA